MFNIFLGVGDRLMKKLGTVFFFVELFVGVGDVWKSEFRYLGGDTFYEDRKIGWRGRREGN